MTMRYDTIHVISIDPALLFTCKWPSDLKQQYIKCQRGTGIGVIDVFVLSAIVSFSFKADFYFVTAYKNAEVLPSVQRSAEVSGRFGN